MAHTFPTDWNKERKTFATKAPGIARYCNNEQQTRISLINPYLKLLGYDVQDPLVCRMEFTADIGKAGERVDYAILQDEKPSILIEAKKAETDIQHETVPNQLQRYFISVDADFAAFTNGLVWCWYRAEFGKGKKLEKTPFIVHDVREPEKREEEWLWSIRGPSFDKDEAKKQAENERVSSAFLRWIEKTRKDPDDNFLRTLFKSLKLGSATKPRLIAARESFVHVLEHYLEQEGQNSEQRAEMVVTGPSAATQAFEQGTSKQSVSRSAAKSRKCAWKIGDGEWKDEKNQTALYLAVLRFLIQHDHREKAEVYQGACTANKKPLFVRRSELTEETAGHHCIDTESDMWTKTQLSQDQKKRQIRALCQFIQPLDNKTFQLGTNVHVRFDETNLTVE